MCIFRPIRDSQQCDIKTIQFDLKKKKKKQKKTWISHTDKYNHSLFQWEVGVWVGWARCIFSDGMCFVLLMFLNKAFITAWPVQASSALSNVHWVG